jgi:hypothetical protein
MVTMHAVCWSSSVTFFFLEMGCSRPLHQLMHTTVILKSVKLVQVYKYQVSREDKD